MISSGLLAIEILEISCNLVLLVTSVYLTAQRFFKFIPVLVYVALALVISGRHLAINFRKNKTYTHEIGFLLFLPRTILAAFTSIFSLVEYLTRYVKAQPSRVVTLVMVIFIFADYTVYVGHFLFHRFRCTHAYLNDNVVPSGPPTRATRVSKYASPYSLKEDTAPPPYSKASQTNNVYGGPLFINDANYYGDGGGSGNAGGGDGGGTVCGGDSGGGGGGDSGGGGGDGGGGGC